MKIYLNTTIEQLYRQGDISTRTFKRLKNSGIRNLNDLLLFSQDYQLSEIPGFGKKCLFEINTAINKLCGLKLPLLLNRSLIHEDSESFLDELFQNTLQEFNRVAAVIKKRFGTGKMLNLALLKNYKDAMSFVENMSYDDNLELRKACLHFFKKIHEHLILSGKYSVNTIKLYEKLEQKIEEYVNVFSDFEIAKYSHDDTMRQYIISIYDDLCRSNPSTRSQNVITDVLPNYYDLISYFDLPLNKYKSICPDMYMHKTLLEVYNLTNTCKETYFDIINRWKDKNEELNLYNKFQFLIENQISKVLDFMSVFHCVPIFYILKIYFTQSNSRSNIMFCLRNGIPTGHCHTLSEIATIFDLSRERVRQILAKKPDIKSLVKITDDDLEPYRELLTKREITETSTEYLVIKDTENLDGDFNFNIFAAILPLMGNYVIEKGRLIRVDGDVVAVTAKFLSQE